MPRTVLRTQRLVLREWSDEDAGDFALMAADAEVVRYLLSGPWPEERSRDWVAREREACLTRGWCRWALSPWGSEDLWGFCGYGCGFAPDVELGWWLRRDLWGRGLATEAARAALQYGFGVIGFPSVISVVHPENSASRRVAEKLGMREDGSVERHGVDLVKYRMDNPLPEVPSDPRFDRDCPQ